MTSGFQFAIGFIRCKQVLWLISRTKPNRQPPVVLNQHIIHFRFSCIEITTFLLFFSFFILGKFAPSYNRLMNNNIYQKQHQNQSNKNRIPFLHFTKLIGFLFNYFWKFSARDRNNCVWNIETKRNITIVWQIIKSIYIWRKKRKCCYIWNSSKFYGLSESVS